jgi:hypothetical protein
MENPKNPPRALPPLYLQDGHTVSTVIVALNGMMPGNYGDMHTGPGLREYAHVSRKHDGTWRVNVKDTRQTFQSGNATRVAQFIMNQVH